MKKSTYTVAHQPAQNKQTAPTIFDQLNQRFVSAVKWNMAETIAYHTLFITHQLSLYSALGAEQYGKAGALFSFSFLSVTFLIGALDIALIPYIQAFTSSKLRFKTLITNYITPQIVFILGSPFFLWILKGTGLVSVLDTFSWTACVLIGIFIAGQAIHKILRRLLQLLFLNKYTAALEVTTLGIYMALFWPAYFLGYPVSISLLLVPFIIASSIVVACFISLLKNYVRDLADTQTSSFTPTHFRTIQMCGIVNQLSRSVFSSNFLIPLFALHAGFKQAGIASLINYGTYTLTFFVQKLCAPAAALFGHSKHLTQKQQHQSFIKSLQLFFAIIALLTVVFGSYGWNSLSTISHTTLLYACFFFLVHILEHLFTLYEKFFAAQNKTLTLTLCNLISCTTSGYAFYMLHNKHFLTAVLVSFTVRAFLFIVLSWFIFATKIESIIWFSKEKSSKRSS